MIIKHLINWLRSDKQKDSFKQKVIKDTNNVDFTSITHDWEKAKSLFDVLKKKCHPDLYVGEQNETATEIFQLLLQSKYDYEGLLKIKEEAQTKLGIDI
jgi:hypothetical protein